MINLLSCDSLLPVGLAIVFAAACAPADSASANATVDVPQMSSGSVSDAPRVVDGMRAAFRNCYQRGIDQNPDVHGTVNIVAKIRSDGDVASATARGGESLGPTVVECVLNRVRVATFDPPEGDAATVRIPVTFSVRH